MHLRMDLQKLRYNVKNAQTIYKLQKTYDNIGLLKINLPPGSHKKKFDRQRIKMKLFYPPATPPIHTKKGNN